jgi:hypothetical protein
VTARKLNPLRPRTLAGQVRNIALRDPAAARQWVEDRSVPVPETGCWLWTATVQTKGLPYGKAWNGERTIVAHRLMWEAAHGPIPAGLQVMHKCDTPQCVNPNHLELGTAAQNIADRDRRAGGHVETKVTHCPRGHAYDEQNTHRRRVTCARQCRACGRARRAAYVAKRRAAGLKIT